MKRRVAVVCVCTLLIAMCAFAMLCATRTFNYLVPAGEKLFSADASQIHSFSDCTLSENGTVTKTGDEPYVEFLELRLTGECVQVQVEGLIPITGANLLFGKNGVYEDEDAQISLIFAEKTTFCIALPEGEFDSLRISVGAEAYRLVSVDVYSECAEEQTTVGASRTRYLAAGAGTLFGLVLIAFAECKFRFSDYVIKGLKKARKPVVEGVCFTGAGALVALLFEVVRSYLCGAVFSREWFLLMYAANIVVAALWHYRREMSKKPEKIVLCITLVASILIMLTIPPSHISWDYDSHFRWALKSSYLGPTYLSKAEFSVMAHQFNWNDINGLKIEEYYRELELLASQLMTVEAPIIKVPHVISGVAIGVARFLGAGFYGQYLLGIIPQILIYSLVCYAAIKRLRSGKILLSVIVLLPTNLFLAASYSYDYWVTAFSLLGTAYFIGMLQDKDARFSMKDTCIMCGAYLLACIPKQIYFTLLLLPFFLRKATFTKADYRKYYRTCVLTICVLIALFVLRSVVVIDSGGDVRGGSEVSAGGQISYILSHPMTYVKTLFGFLKDYLWTSGLRGYVANFAYLGKGTLYGFGGALILLTALTDRGAGDAFRGKHLLAGVSALFYVGTAILLATAFYIAYTPVGADVINGCQERYLIPLLFPFFGLCFNPGVCRLSGKRWYHYAVLIMSVMILFGSIYALVITKVTA